MINFLPVLYEDELLYSLIARYRQMCGMRSKRALVEDLFGELKVINSSYFPQYISALISNFPPTSKLTAKEIIMNHTLFPFYTAFLSEQKTRTIYHFMKEGSNGSHHNIEKHLGWGGSKVKAANHLKYCPVCFKEDQEKLGESYWRRIHQIVGVLYCPKHQVLLKESSALSTGDGIEFICTDHVVCDEEALPDFYSGKVKELNLYYMRDVVKLLHGNFSRKNLNEIIGFYVDRLRERGLASAAGSLNMNEVQHRFLKCYPEMYLKLMQCDFDPDKSSNWLRLFVRNNNKNRSPLRHLLFLQFLRVGLDEFFSVARIVGKRGVSEQHNPSFSINERRAKWQKLIEENKGANRAQLKVIGKGLHTWIFKHDREWYEKVTPKNLPRKNREETVDWEKRDEECLKLAKEAVHTILNRVGKPTRITPSNIRRTVGAKNWFKNKKMVRTNEYMKEITEDINDFRIRKIKWAIEKMIREGIPLTSYKIQLYAGFGGNNAEVRTMIIEVLEDI